MTDIVERRFWELGRMSIDLVERLRDAASDLAVEAADEIERLQAEYEAWRECAQMNAGRYTEAAAEIERLKAQLARTETALDNEFNNGIALCAEIEQLRAPKEPPPSPDIRGTSFRRG